jgi:hypothetical protein
MTDLHIDRLTLRLAGLSAADGRRLAPLVADHLAAADRPGAAASAGRLRMSVAPHPAVRLDRSRRITRRCWPAEACRVVSRSLRRSVATTR